MFNLFRRGTATPPKAQPKKPAAAGQAPIDDGARKHVQTVPRPPAPVISEPPPAPEVLEGNDNSDWALWEDSVMVMDSQMQGLTPSARIYEREKATPSEFQDLDPFESVRKKGA